MDAKLINDRRMQAAKALASGAVLLFTDFDRDDMTVAERVSAAAELMEQEGDNAGQSVANTRRPVLH